jgi:TonB family protein
VPATPDHGGRGKTGDDIDRTKVVDFGAYMAALERRIKRNWTPPRIPNSKRVVARFVIARDGTLSHLAIANSSGVANVDQAALKAIEMAAPFPPLPAGADETVDIQFTFDYNVFGGHATTF